MNNTERIYFNGVRSVKRLNCAVWWKGTTALFPDYSDETTWLPQWKYLLETPVNAISKTSKFQNASLCLWCKFQTHLLFIISLLLKNFLTALHYINILYMPSWKICEWHSTSHVDSYWTAVFVFNYQFVGIFIHK